MRKNKNNSTSNLKIASNNVEVSNISEYATTNVTDKSTFVSPIMNMNLVEASAKLPFANALGSAVDPIGENIGNGKYAYSYAGVMVIDVMPIIGTSVDNQSAINIVAKQIFQKLRKVNQGSIKYTPADVMRYLIALDSLVYLSTYIRRAFRVSDNFQLYNKFTPDYMLQLMGVDPIDLRYHLANHIARTEFIMKKMRQLTWLRDFQMITDHASLFNNVFSDGETARDQMYMLRPYGYYTYEPLATNNKNILKFNKIDYTTTGDMTSWLNLLEEAVNKVAYTDTYSEIAGQMNNAFGEQSVSIDYISGYDTLEPIVNEDFVKVISNARMLNEIGSLTDMDIYEDLTQTNNVGSLIFQPTIDVSSNVIDMATSTTLKILTRPNLINTVEPFPSPENIYHMTRWVPSFTRLSNPATKSVYVHGGTELLLTATIYSIEYINGTSHLVSIPLKTTYIIDRNASVTIQNGVYDEVATISARMTDFKWYPPVDLYYILTTGLPMKDYGYLGRMQNVSNYAVVPTDMLKRLHEIRQFEAFNIKDVTTVGTK